MRGGGQWDQQHRRAGDEGRAGDRGPDAELSGDPAHDERACQGAEASEREAEADQLRRQVPPPDGVDEENREQDAAEEVVRGDADAQRPPEAVSEEIAEALPQLTPHAPADGPLGRGFRPADDADEQGRPDEARRVDEDRVRGGRQADDHAAESRPADLRSRAADLELRVAVDQLLPVDERREIGLVRDVEEDGQRADGEADGIELPDRQCAEPVRQRHRRERRRANEVGEDEDRLAPQPVDPDARREREEQEGQEVDGVQGGDLERARVQDDDRRERDREGRHLRPELADRLRRPELQEVGMPPESPARPKD